MRINIVKPCPQSLRSFGLGLLLAASLTACGGGGGSDGGSNDDGTGGTGGAGGASAQGWSKLVGTPGARTHGDHVALDPSGNVFIAGTTDGDLNGTFEGTGQRNYLAKYSSSGSLLFLDQIPTANGNAAGPVNGLATDRDGRVYVVASEWANAEEQHRPVLMTFSSEGALLDEVDLGIDGEVVWIDALAVDADANAIVAGWTYGPSTGTSMGTASYLVAKYGPDGVLLWRQIYHALNELGLPAGTWVYDLTVDGAGNIYLTGPTKGRLHGNSLVGGYENGSYYIDSFLVKFDPDGNLTYARQFGGYRSQTWARGIAVDESGRIFIAGEIRGNFQGETRYGDSDYFLAHFDMSGNLQDTQQLGAPGGGSTVTRAQSVATDPAGNIYVAGSTTGSIDGVPEVGYVDGFVSKYDPSVYRVATQQFGGVNGNGYFNDVTSDDSGNVHLTGGVSGDSFEGTVIQGEADGVLSRHNGDWTQLTGESGGDSGSGSGDNPDSALDWKESWKFVQGDKAVQYRLALVRVEGDHHIFRIQYRVNSEDGIYTSASKGYHLYRLDDQSFSYRVEFPASFHGLSVIYQLPAEIAVFVNGSDVEWNSTTNNLIYHNRAYSPSGYSSCVDDNSADSRCEGYYRWDRPSVDAEYTATDNT